MGVQVPSSAPKIESFTGFQHFVELFVLSKIQWVIFNTLDSIKLSPISQERGREIMGKRVTKISQSKSKKSFEDALNEFLLLKRAEGRSETTLSDYERHVYYFFNRYPTSWTDNTLKNCVLQYMSDDIKPATYNIRRAYLKTFFEWSVNEGYLDINPLEGLKKRKAQERIVDVPEEILAKLIKLPDQTSFTGVRDKSLIIFTLDCGIRPKEAHNLASPLNRLIDNKKRVGKIKK